MIRRRILSSYARERIKILAPKDASVSEILLALDKDGVVTCCQNCMAHYPAYKFARKHSSTS